MVRDDIRRVLGLRVDHRHITRTIAISSITCLGDFVELGNRRTHPDAMALARCARNRMRPGVHRGIGSVVVHRARIFASDRRRKSDSAKLIASQLAV